MYVDASLSPTRSTSRSRFGPELMSQIAPTRPGVYHLSADVSHASWTPPPTHVHGDVRLDDDCMVHHTNNGWLCGLHRTGGSRHCRPSRCCGGTSSCCSASWTAPSDGMGSWAIHNSASSNTSTRNKVPPADSRADRWTTHIESDRRLTTYHV